MAATKINAANQIQSGSITRALINTTTSGSALITKLFAGTNIVIGSYTGVDSGTGDVTLNATNYSNRRTVPDTAASVAATDQIIALTSITASRNLSLCSAASYPPGSELLLKDESGSLSTSIVWNIVPNGTDTIQGLSSLVMNYPYGEIFLTSNGGTKWFIASSTNYASNTTAGAGTDTTMPLNSAGAASAVAQIPFTATNGSTARNNATRWSDQINLKDFGAKGNALTLSDANITSGSAILTSSSAVFTTADIGKSITIIGAGSSGANLTTTISSVTNSTTVVLAANASTTISSSNYFGSYAIPVAFGTGYVPGDTYTPSGGTNSTAVIYSIYATQVVSAVIKNAGTGGTAGPCILTGTTGTGNKFTINATISNGSVSQINSIISAGFYTTNPTTLSTEPVTCSSAGISGVTLTIVMGVAGAVVSTPGLYTALPTNPVSQSSTSGSGTGATFTAGFDTQGIYTYGNDDSAALTSAVNLSNTKTTSGLPPCRIYIPAGKYLIKTAPPVLTGNGCIVGDGTNQTNIILDPSFTGDLFSWSDAWLLNYPFTASSYSGYLKAGPIIKDLSVVGNRKANGQQNAFVFYDRNDNVVIDKVDVSFLPGRALYSGVTKNSSQAFMRESRITEFRAFNSGTTNVSAVEFNSNGTNDATNEIRILNMDIYGSYGPSFIMRSANGVLRLIDITNLRVEGKENNPAGVQADLVTIGDASLTGQVANLTIRGLELIDPYGGFAALRVTANSYSKASYNIDVTGMIVGGAQQSGTRGLQLDVCRDSFFRFSSLYTTGNSVTVASSSTIGGVIGLSGYGEENNWTTAIDSSSTTFISQSLYKTGSTGLDLQFSRANVSQTASGSASTTIGSNNTASGPSAVAIGTGNTSSGNTSVCIGNSNNVSNNFSFATGQGNTVSGSPAFACGYGNTNTASSGFVSGYQCSVGGTGSVVFGITATDRNKYGVQTNASGYFSTSGDAQYSVQLLRGSTSSTSNATLTADGNTANTYNVANIPDNTSYFVEITLIARDITTPANVYTAKWLTCHDLSRGSGASSTLFDGITTSVLPDEYQIRGSATGMAATIKADTTNGGLVVLFTPPSGNTDTWHIVAKVGTVEVQ